jgi:hypothetical protein
MKYGYGNIQQNDIREQPRCFSNSVFAVRCFAANHPVVQIVLKKILQGIAEYFGIVCN